LGYKQIKKYSENTNFNICKGITPRNIGDRLMHLDDESMDAAEVWIKKAIETDQETAHHGIWPLITFSMPTGSHIRVISHVLENNCPRLMRYSMNAVPMVG
jgi:hypothetical protein